jgi:hypothetical protein
MHTRGSSLILGDRPPLLGATGPDMSPVPDLHSTPAKLPWALLRRRRRTLTLAVALLLLIGPIAHATSGRLHASSSMISAIVITVAFSARGSHCCCDQGLPVSCVRQAVRVRGPVRYEGIWAKGCPWCGISFGAALSANHHTTLIERNKQHECTAGNE